jgi:class 3 adenylate cyclase
VGGQIVISEVVRGLVGSGGSVSLRDLGARDIGLRAPVQLWEVTWHADDDHASASSEGAVTRTPRQGGMPVRPADTVIIMFADIVDSMPHTERLGDAMFRERARELDRLLRSLVAEHRGSTVEGKLVGDGVLAVFPSAQSGIGCALRCGVLSASVGLELHIGLHAGDVIRDGGNIYGGAVNIASRISGATKPGEILVSDTVRGLARTSVGVAFEDRGAYQLKGIDEPMRLFGIS